MLCQGILGRADDMLHVKGINVFPNGIAIVLEDIVSEVTGEFQIILNHPSPYASIDIIVEHGSAVTQNRMNLKSQCGAPCIIV